MVMSDVASNNKEKDSVDDKLCYEDKIMSKILLYLVMN